jgi:glycosyltransferase involved in cell wall biosynthesis
MMNVISSPAVAHRSATHALTAVICTYNRYDVLSGAIDSLMRQDIGSSDFEIIVVDNSPDQNAAELFGRAYGHTKVQYILEPIPGLSNARNVGAERSRARYVAYIDDDAIAAPDWASKLVAGFEQFGDAVGVAGGRIIPRWITPRPDWLPDELVGNLSIVDWGGQTRLIGRNEWLAGCNIGFNRAMLLSLGGFSRALGRTGSGAALLSNEESAVIEKFAEQNKKAIYVPEASVEHLIEPARLSQEWFRRRAAWQAVSDYIKDPKKSAAYAGAAAERLRRELLSDEYELPPGFSRPNADRDEFRRDVGLMYDVIIAMLAGGVELSEDGGSKASLQNKLVANVRREMQRNPQLRNAIRKLSNL